jgi:hypothetical protein
MPPKPIPKPQLKAEDSTSDHDDAHEERISAHEERITTLENNV